MQVSDEMLLALASVLVEKSRLIAALDARRREIKTAEMKAAGYLATPVVDALCALFAAAGRLRDCRPMRMNGLWLMEFFGDSRRMAEAGDRSAQAVVRVVDEVLSNEIKGARK